MPFPKIPHIEEALSAITLSPNSPDRGSAAVQIPLLPAADEEGRVSQEALWLHYSTTAKIGFERLLEQVAKQLEFARHPKPEEFALFALALSRLLRGKEGTSIARANIVLDSVSDADVTLYYVITPAFPDFYKFEIPPFRLGRLRSDKLKYRSDKAGSDYYGRYSEFFREAWAIEREPKKVRVIDSMRFRDLIFGGPLLGHERDGWEYRAWDALTNGYFSILNRVLFNDFWAELISAQDALLALGATYFDPQAIRSSIFQNQQVAVFLNLGTPQGGYVAPAGTGLPNIDLANTHVKIPQLLGELRDQYGFQQFDASPLHSTIKLFASFLARARRHQLSGLVDEALVHFVIALELIFGVREGIQRSVSERVALITFQGSGRSYEQQRDWINDVYDLRSRYVHKGLKIADNAPVQQTYELCADVFRCLLRLQAALPNPDQRGAEALDKWLSLLDFLSKGIIAGKTISPKDFEEVHIMHR
ncbi:MAG TPA: hypothetical protein VMT72_02340 [Pseudolabrys sp.]|nr:hypothetical protein [Pseudolabrys sp.]